MNETQNVCIKDGVYICIYVYITHMTTHAYIHRNRAMSDTIHIMFIQSNSSNRNNTQHYYVQTVVDRDSNHGGGG